MPTELTEMNVQKTVATLKSSLYPGAADASVRMVLDYCQARKLDPFLKPVHIVPMWDSKAKEMRDVIMPGLNLYRTLPRAASLQESASPCSGRCSNSS